MLSADRCSNASVVTCAELCVFGHSIGAQVALLLEARQPGLFTAMYMWECVIHDPAIM